MASSPFKVGQWVLYNHKMHKVVFDGTDKALFVNNKHGLYYPDWTKVDRV